MTNCFFFLNKERWIFPKFLFHIRAWVHYLSSSLGIQTQTEAISASMWPNLMCCGCEGTQQQRTQQNGAGFIGVCLWVGLQRKHTRVTTLERSLIFCSSPGVIKPKKHNDARLWCLLFYSLQHKTYAGGALSFQRNESCHFRRFPNAISNPKSSLCKCERAEIQLRHTHNWSLRKEEFARTLFLVPPGRREQRGVLINFASAESFLWRYVYGMRKSVINLYCSCSSQSPLCPERAREKDYCDGSK